MATTRLVIADRAYRVPAGAPFGVTDVFGSSTCLWDGRAGGFVLAPAGVQLRNSTYRVARLSTWGTAKTTSAALRKLQEARLALAVSAGVTKRNRAEKKAALLKRQAAAGSGQ
eukprot:TRINITY_DN14499_c0_g1_i1.p1 TRINITY_DN14499_c0_g1~~TRINITY_DN14499_c0_g1_i1.p1  ORF type:complete len:128 (+),score=31.82 TRINITY_DN14499_c0_g1_i1:48-386(+)